MVFNKTEFDFGKLAPTNVPFEEDFIFRNTGSQAVSIISVRSISSAISFVYTRSEIFSGEYGFVKVKLRTDSISGLFHDEVYVTMKEGNEIVSEVLYIRAQIHKEGRSKANRQFEDSHAAVSVEVSPEDIENMEGFLGKDRITQAESEINYLRKQVSLKTDLISKLSEDLQQKQSEEQENIRRLNELEATLKAGNTGDLGMVLNQINELTQRLREVQKSDGELRQAIADQEAHYHRLKYEADSARAYASNLSAKLQEQFKVQAEASQRAMKLEADLTRKQLIEAEQRAQIDSLEKLLASGEGSSVLVSGEINRLKSELAMRQKEQVLQSNHAKLQHEKIEKLNTERSRLLNRTDSLALYLSSRNSENQMLAQKLEATAGRIHSYEKQLKSLRSEAGFNNEQSKQLDSLQTILANLESTDAEMKANIRNKEAEILSLQSNQQKSQQELLAMEAASKKQYEEAQSLLQRVNQLSEKESLARMEVGNLRNALKTSEAREDASRNDVLALSQKIAEKEASMKNVTTSLAARETDLLKLKGESAKLQNEYRKTQSLLSVNSQTIDSLKRESDWANQRKNDLENDIATLQNQIVESQRKQQSYANHATELESKLANARMSNDMVFTELKKEVDLLQAERDEYMNKYNAAMLEIKRMNESGSPVRAKAASSPSQSVAASKPVVNPNTIIYRVSVVAGTEPMASKQKLLAFGEVLEYQEANFYKYAIGSEKSFDDAIQLRNRIKAQGYTTAYVVAFRNGERISLREAMETAAF